MPASILGKISDAEECADLIAAIPWTGAATYVLWHRETGEPIYCGTAVSRGRLKSHLKKDDPRSRPTAHNLRNPELLAFWRSQPKGWLGVSFKLFADENEARTIERQIIAAYGIRRTGGKLFNQRISG